VRAGDTLVVPNSTGSRAQHLTLVIVADSQVARGSKLSLGGQVYGLAGPMGKMFFQRLGHVRRVPRSTCCRCAPPRAGRDEGERQAAGQAAKALAKQRRELLRVRGTGEYTVADLGEVFTVSRMTVYRTLERGPPPVKARGSNRPLPLLCTSGQLREFWAKMHRQFTGGAIGVLLAP
jgi:hypothetical protein